MVNCPYCEHDNYIEVSDGISETFSEMQCYNCDNVFLYKSFIEIFHSVKRADCLNGFSDCSFKESIGYPKGKMVCIHCLKEKK